jgi:hypothetical protein
MQLESPKPSTHVAPNIVTAAFGALLAQPLIEIVEFAFVTARQPGCMPNYRPDRWPTLYWVIGISALVVVLGIAASWATSRLCETDGSWVVALGFITLLVYIVLFCMLLFMSLMTFC